MVQLRFEVEDSGVGIKQEHIPKLFKMFGKVGADNDELNPNGIGLGLTICNKILGQFSSVLQVSSVHGKGTKFFFVIDLQQIADQSELEKMFYSPLESHPDFREQSNRSVLITEDDTQFPLQIKDNSFKKPDIPHYDRATPQKRPNSVRQKDMDLLTSGADLQRRQSEMHVPDFFQNSGKYTNIYEMQREVDMHFADLNAAQVPGEEEKSPSGCLALQPSAGKYFSGNPVVNYETLDQPHNCECTRILIVDDNTFNVYTLQMMLQMQFNLSADIVSVFPHFPGLQRGGSGRQGAAPAQEPQLPSLQQTVSPRSFIFQVRGDLHGHPDAGHGRLRGERPDPQDGTRLPRPQREAVLRGGADGAQHRVLPAEVLQLWHERVQ